MAILVADTMILTSKGYRPLFTLHQGVPVVTFDLDTKTFKLVPLSYKIFRTSLTDTSKLRRRKIYQKYEVFFNKKWVDGGGCSMWYNMAKNCKTLDTKGNIIKITKDSNIMCVSLKSFPELSKADDKFRMASYANILEQLEANIEKQSYYSKSYKDLEYIKPSKAYSLTNGYKNRPTVNAIIVDSIIPDEVKYPLVKTSHGIITNGIYID